QVIADSDFYETTMMLDNAIMSIMKYGATTDVIYGKDEVDAPAKNKVVKSPEQNQELAMLDLEIAALKLEVLTQTEIAKNNKDAYDKIR
ncbi:hypothetical protein ACQKG8_25455, partial [Escherichia coli]|uniref:hypothetical protein n=1 Tax=Escherichia coli TaxID=562 RepID=UPI003CFF1229